MHWNRTKGIKKSSFMSQVCRRMWDLAQANGSMQIWRSGDSQSRGGTGEYTYDGSGSERKIPSRSWGAAKKVPYFTTLSRILVVIRAQGKMLTGFLVSNEGYSLRQSHANM